MSVQMTRTLGHAPTSAEASVRRYPGPRQVAYRDPVGRLSRRSPGERGQRDGSGIVLRGVDLLLVAQAQV
jgi:hypothetical protein